MPGGRPTKYNDELAAEICSLLSTGMSLNKICQMDGMPVASTVYLWMFKNPEFSDRYAKAKEDSAEALAEQMFEIADDVGEADDSVKVNRSRLRVDTRKWYLSKIKPKKYGEKQQVDHTSSDGSMSMTERLARGRSRANGED